MKKKSILLIFFITLNLYSNELRIGMSGDFSGSISYLGNNMKMGIESYFNKINKSSSTQYKLISYDDKYNPVLASQNVKKLIHKDKVVTLLGNTGTPTATVTLPIINKNKIPLIGPYSGGKILRDPQTNTFSFNYRVGYYNEVSQIVSNLFNKGIKSDELAVFTQNDTYGDSGYLGVLEAFRSRNISINNIIHERYTKGTENIEYGLSKLLDYNKNFKAFIVVGVNKATTKFIKYAKEDFPNAKFFLISAMNISTILNSLKEYEDDVYSTQVVPLLSEKLPIVKEYKKDFKKLYPNEKTNLISFEGYIIAKLFHEVIKELKPEEINRKNIERQLLSVENIDIGLGFKSSFNNEKHQYSNRVWLTRVKNGELQNVSWKEIEVK